MADIETVKEIACDDGVSFDYDELGEKLDELASEAVDDPFPSVYVRHQGLLFSPTKATLYKSTDDDGDVTWEIILDVE
ncbi:hypothetical protein [Rhizobium leguminosarum]|uniref:hypothetical protein n=1 Tax=Rhizobium leguminosarum TaxID=384 RepID=UPI001441E771|nr:hypothetical protein [Rhizobium leguminosarum]MDH6273595.1 hypothetical protein [Rhizobium leguminosarum]NKK01050.1 hypothetical protein [Rhizobium leguminosarum bv. viciae]